MDETKKTENQNFKSYGEEINCRLSAVHQRGTALKILEHMDKIRNNYSRDLARRWPQELLQNAVDAGVKGRPVRARIVLSDDRVEFSHNGAPFKLDHIISLINQVSSKKRENTEAIGRFGTGFVTTFQLSEKVELMGILEDGGLSPRKFKIMLDRSGRDHEAITASITASMEMLAETDKAEDADYDPDDYNTSFIYHLDTQESRECAGIGVEDLCNTSGYILMFSEGLESIEIQDLRTDGAQGFHYYTEDTIPVAETGAVLHTITDEKKNEKLHFLSLSESGITLSIPVDPDEKKALAILDGAPRLYIGFPLIGSDRFPFPTVINSRNFNPNEPRSGITLVENSTSIDAAENRVLISSAVSLYKRFMGILLDTGYEALENAVMLPDWAADPLMPENYIKELIGMICNRLSELALIMTEEGRISFNDTRLKLVDGRDKDEVRALKELQGMVNGVLVPTGEERWHEVLQHYPVRNGLITNLEIMLENAGKILRKGFRTKIKPVRWLAKLVETAFKNDLYRVRICSGEYAVFISQSESEQETHILHRFTDLLRDDIEDEELKEISDSLGQKNKNCIKKRELFDRAYDLKEINCRACSKYRITSGIVSAVDNILLTQSLGEAEEWVQDICANLLAWICDHRKEAGNYFPSYSSEIGQAKLMTPRATARMRKEKQELKLENESLKEELLKKEKELQVLKETNAAGRIGEYNEEYGVVFEPDELGFGTDEELTAFCRRVGEGGERYAVEYLAEQYRQKGYVDNNCADDGDISQIRLDRTDGTSVTIQRADNKYHKQEGYDIVITESAPDKTERIVYVEVKTHTERSSNRKHLKLSNSQMVNAARHLENFLLLHVIWDKSAMQALGAELFSNPIRCIADGRLKNTFGEYVFKIA